MHNPSETPSLTAVKTPISEDALDQLFREARTHSAWLPDPVPVELLRMAYELARNRSEEHTSELQSQSNLVCRLLLETNNRAPARKSDLSIPNSNSHDPTAI